MAPAAERPLAATFSKTIGESDVAGFAGISGDLNPVHIDETYARAAGMPGRIAHGVLVLGLMSTACSLYAQREGLQILSYGWEHVRFIHPVALGDTITTAYAPFDGDPSGPQTGLKQEFDAEARNQRGEVVAVGRHIMYRLTDEGSPAPRVA